MTGTVETTIDTRRFQAQIPDEELTELRRRIEATRSASQALDGVRVRLRLAGLDAEDATRRSDGLRRRLDRIEERAGDAVDLAAAGVRHLLDELHRSAAQAEHELATAVTAETRRRLDSYLSSLPVGDLQREGRGIVVDIVRNTVESWRASQQARLRAVATAERCCRHRRRPAPSAVYSRLLPRA